MSQNSNDSNLNAGIYRLIAVNFWESAKIIDEKLNKNSDGMPKKLLAIPFYYLISHSVELFLKSALLKRGCIVKELTKPKYRHDLKNLLNLLQNKGVRVSAETVMVINGLHGQHKKHGLRYEMLLGRMKFSWFPTHLLHKALEELLSLTRLSTQGR